MTSGRIVFEKEMHMRSISRRDALLTVVSGAGALVSGTAVAAARRERQPKMHGALTALRRAQRELEAAEHDKGGHREKALELVRSAISEVEAGIAYDRTH
jgi:hypothetical protein